MYNDLIKICKKLAIKHYKINNDFISANFVNLYDKKLYSIPANFDICYVFNIGFNNIKILKGSPNRVNVFICNNNKLSSLEGCPKWINNYLDCRWNMIKSFEGLGYIGRQLICGGNPIYPLWCLFRDTSKIEMFNEWGIIQGDNVILYRLNDFLEEIGKPEVNKRQLIEIKRHYNIIN